ncbi:MAG: hypothetical protein AB7I33_15720, partial [Gemmatimonadales bacterium]
MSTAAGTKRGPAGRTGRLRNLPVLAIVPAIMLANPAPLSPRPGVIEIDTLTVTSRDLTRTHTVR